MTKEEIEKQIHDFAEMMYKVGFEDGHEKCKNKIFLESAIYPKAMKDGYNQGLEAIWKNLMKLCELKPAEINKIFGARFDNLYCIITGYSPTEFIDAIKAYEEQLKAPSEATICSILEDDCPYNIKCEECEVHCSIERAKQKLKGDKE